MVRTGVKVWERKNVCYGKYPLYIVYNVYTWHFILTWLRHPQQFANGLGKEILGDYHSNMLCMT